MDKYPIQGEYKHSRSLHTTQTGVKRGGGGGGADFTFYNAHNKVLCPFTIT